MTPQNKKKLLEKHRAGSTQHELAAEFGISQSKVHMILKGLGVESKQELTRLKVLHLAGTHSRKDIATLLGVSYQTVCKALKSLSKDPIDIPKVISRETGRVGELNNNCAMDDELFERIYRKYTEGDSILYLSDLVPISYAALRQRINRRLKLVDVVDDIQTVKRVEVSMDKFEGIWVPVGDSMNYFVSSDGRVRSLHRVLKPQGSQVSVDGKRINIGKAVAMGYLPNPEGLTKVVHIDGDISNNNVSNLEWYNPRGNTASYSKNPISPIRAIMIREEWCTGKFSLTQLKMRHNRRIAEINNVLDNVIHEDSTFDKYLDINNEVVLEVEVCWNRGMEVKDICSKLDISFDAAKLIIGEMR